MKGRDSLELEVFGMSGVPEGAAPGASLLEGDAKAVSFCAHKANIIEAPVWHLSTTSSAAVNHEAL